MKIAIVISSLSSGGAERVTVNLANYWAKHGKDVTIITFSNQESFYELDSAIDFRPLGVSKESYSFLDQIKNFINRYKALENKIQEVSPDLIVSVMDKTNVIATIVAKKNRIPIIVSEHRVLEDYNIGLMWSILRYLTYPFCDKLVGVSKPIVEYFPKFIRSKGEVIHNPVALELCNLSINQSKKKSNILVAMGRLDQQKGFDLLIKAFSKVQKKYKEWKLIIWGEGKERNNLESIRGYLGLEDKVILPGLTKNPAKEFARSEIFILSSRSEGFGNVLVEAMSCGLPVVSFNCPSGPKEIVQHEHNGLLVPPENINELANAISYMIENPEERSRMGRNALEVRERFGMETIGSEWDDILNEVLK